ncbi:ketosteroid isomerase-related protein [uncultured Jannaschia sp.]|uniref:ketosteroid isomerase-related protein n=1 Tax=uncultured Jannaschia sp. TaxID=293347 RepID=UPI002614AD6A|nr:ketosteroid isomerase-related protein [uncultured Jannaschia sp.]
MSIDLIERYYAAFNDDDTDAMLACLAPDVAHHVNEGEVRRGRDAFRAFREHMARAYRETLSDIVVLAGPDGRYAAEFTVTGTYLETDPGLPEARGQTYSLPAGAFFTVTDGAITRVVTYYNLADWIRQVS